MEVEGVKIGGRGEDEKQVGDAMGEVVGDGQIVGEGGRRVMAL